MTDTDTNGNATGNTTSTNDQIVADANASLPVPQAPTDATTTQPDPTAVTDAVTAAAIVAAGVVSANVETASTSENQTEAADTTADQPLDVSQLDSVLKALGHLAQDDASAPQAIIDLAATVIMQYNAVLKNAGVMLVHTQSVYESMAERGAYPDELVEGTPCYKGRKGFADLKTVINQVMPVFNNAQKAPVAPPAPPATAA